MGSCYVCVTCFVGAIHGVPPPPWLQENQLLVGRLDEVGCSLTVMSENIFENQSSDIFFMTNQNTHKHFFTNQNHTLKQTKDVLSYNDGRS